MVINPSALSLERREGTFGSAGKSLACYNIPISLLSRETPGGRNASLCECFCHVASLSFIQPLKKKEREKKKTKAKPQAHAVKVWTQRASLWLHWQYKWGVWKQSKQSEISHILQLAEYNQDISARVKHQIKQRSWVDLETGMTQALLPYALFSRPVEPQEPVQIELYCFLKMLNRTFRNGSGESAALVLVWNEYVYEQRGPSYKSRGKLIH